MTYKHTADAQLPNILADTHFPRVPAAHAAGEDAEAAPGSAARTDGTGGATLHPLASACLSRRLWRPTPRPSWSWRSPGASCVVSLIPCGHACFSPAVMPAVLCPRSSRPARLGLRRASAVQGLEQHRRRRVPGGDAPGAALPGVRHLTPAMLRHRCGCRGLSGQFFGPLAAHVFHRALPVSAEHLLCASQPE